MTRSTIATLCIWFNQLTMVLMSFSRDTQGCSLADFNIRHRHARVYECRSPYRLSCKIIKRANPRSFRNACVFKRKYTTLKIIRRAREI